MADHTHHLSSQVHCLLQGSIQRLEATKSDQMIIIAERAKLALLNAGYTEGVSPDTIKAHQLALSK